MKKVNPRNNSKAKAAKTQSSSRNGTSLHASRIDLSAKARIQIIDALNHTLAQTVDLKTQVKHAHWNVKGMQFYSLHLLFDEIAEELEGYSDMIAERITALAGVARGTVRMAAKETDLPEISPDILDGIDFVAALADRFARYGEAVREGIDYCDQLDDKDTADLYTEISREADKRLWFLEAHLQA